MTELPCVTVLPHGDVQLLGSPTVHELYWYEPESEPSEHVRLSEAHDEPYGTEDDWYAVTEVHSATD